MELNKIAVFGGTGRTGVHFLKKALDQGYTIQAMIRNLDRAPLQHPNLIWITGDVLNPVAIDLTLAGTQAVVSFIGQVKNSPATLQTTAMQLIVNNMKAKGVKRLISLTGGGVRNEQTDKPGFTDKAIVFIMKNLAGKVTRESLQDGIGHAAIIRQSSLQWTIVRGPMLTDDLEKGSYQVGSVGTVKGFKLTRGDLAAFIVSTLTNGTYIGQMPFLVN